MLHFGEICLWRGRDRGADHAYRRQEEPKGFTVAGKEPTTSQRLGGERENRPLSSRKRVGKEAYRIRFVPVRRGVEKRASTKEGLRGRKHIRPMMREKKCTAQATRRGTLKSSGA